MEVSLTMFTTQFHVKEQGAAKPIHRRALRRQDESVLKNFLTSIVGFIDVSSVVCFARDY